MKSDNKTRKSEFVFTVLALLVLAIGFITIKPYLTGYGVMKE